MTVPWILVANAFNRALTIATQLVVGFLLVPEQVGLFVVAAGIAGLSSPFQSADHARLALQDRDYPAATASILRNWLLLGALGSCVVAIVVLPAIGLAVAVAPLACIALLALLRVMANLRISLLSLAGRSAAIAAASVSESAARSLVLVGSALLGAGMWSLVFGEVAAVLISLLLLARFEPGPPAGGWRMPPWLPRRLLTTLGISLLVGVEVNCSAIAIGNLIGTASAGSFAFANRIAGQLVVLLLPLIALEVIPRLIAARDAAQRFRETSQSECRRLLRIILPLMIMLMVVGPWAMIQLWGERWREAAGMLRWLSLSIGLRLSYALAKAHLEALGDFRRILLLSVFDTVLILSAVVLVGLSGDATAVVVALAAESALILGLAVMSVRHSMPALTKVHT